MKIVCDSCGAKYSIADEKVAGKVFKIRCKKCSAVIVVRGDEVSPREDAGTGVGIPADDPGAVWYVVVDGEQQGPYQPEQLAGLMAEGTMNLDSYVWRDGFEGWLAAREVSELAGVLGQEAAPAPAASGQAGAFGGATDEGALGAAAAADSATAAAGSAASFGEDPFAASAETAAPAEAAPSLGADLFAQSSEEPSPFVAAAASPAASPVQPVAAAPAPAASASAEGGDDSMTGRRSENSVLFSLSNLQALATGGDSGGPQTSGPARPAPAPSGGSSTEGSGLIDIRALASTTQSTDGPKASSSDNIDDLLSIGTGSALASSLTAPVMSSAEEPKGNNRMMLYLIGFLGFSLIVAAAVVAAVYFLRTPVAPTAGMPPTQIAPTPGATTPLPATEAAPDPTTTETGETPNEGSEVEPTKTATTGRQPRRTDERRPTDRPTTMRDRPTTATAPTPTPMVATMATAMSPTMMLNIDDLINGATPMNTTMTAGPDPSLPESPSRSQVASALRGVSGQVRACGNGQHGQAMVAVVVAGATGRVQSANVQGQFAGTPQGACIQRAVRGARFPRFQRSTFTVNFPYML